MPSARLYHNADCSKCRGALALLAERGVVPEIVNYLEHPPSVDELRTLASMLALPPRALLRHSDQDAVNLVESSASDDAILEALHANPGWLQRPIFVVGNRAVIARPPERVLEVLNAVD